MRRIAMLSLALSGGCALLLGVVSLAWRTLLAPRLVMLNTTLGWWSPNWPAPTATFTLSLLVAGHVLVILAVAIATPRPARGRGLTKKEQ